MTTAMIQRVAHAAHNGLPAGRYYLVTCDHPKHADTVFLGEYQTREYAERAGLLHDAAQHPLPTINTTPVDGDRSQRAMWVQHTERGDDTAAHLTVSWQDGNADRAVEVLLTRQQVQDLVDSLGLAVARTWAHNTRSRQGVTS